MMKMITDNDNNEWHSNYNLYRQYPINYVFLLEISHDNFRGNTKQQINWYWKITT